MGLDVCVLCTKELFRSLYGKLLHLVHILAAAVIPGAGIALGIFIGEMAAHSLHDCKGYKVFRSDELYMISLPLQLPHHGGIDFRVLLLYLFIAHWDIPPVFSIIFPNIILHARVFGNIHYLPKYACPLAEQMVKLNTIFRKLQIN